MSKKLINQNPYYNLELLNSMGSNFIFNKNPISRLKTLIKDPITKLSDKKTNKIKDLGDGAILELSDQILVDGNWTTMPDGYPSYEQKGGKQIYTFRFPKFTDTAFYDPIVGFDSSVEGSYASSGTRSASLSMSTLLVLIVGVVFGMIGGTVGMVSL